jgi:hypothetical protein
MNLRQGVGLNEPSLAMRQQCDALEGGNTNVCDAQVANPFFGIPAFGSNRSTATLSAWELSRPMPEFGGFSNNADNGSKTWYNSLQVTYDTRNWRGLSARAAHTWAKFIEQYGWSDFQQRIPQRGLINVSIPSSFRALGSYDLPFGPGKTFARSTNPVARRIADGWQYNLVWTWNAGYPMNNNAGLIPLANASVGEPDYGTSGQYVRVFNPCAVTIPNVAGQPWTFISHGAAVDQQFGCTAANAAWAQKPRYAPDNMLSYRNSAFHAMNLWQVDMSITKSTRITEKVSLQFRAEAQNIFNHYSFFQGQPNTNPTDPAFGTINKNTVGETSSTLPRQIQLGAKFIW